MTEHVCNLNDPWPTGHPLPSEDPAKLQGPEVGEEVIYHHVRRWGQGIDDSGKTIWHEEVVDQPATVLNRSYVWSPGECRSRGGHRLYNSKVIRTLGHSAEGQPDRWYTVVVNDTDLRRVNIEKEND